jgi:hypothetical protein
MSNIVTIATKEVGYSETPTNSNKTKYGKWFGLDGVAWCGMFVSWVYDKAGVPLGNIGFTKGFAGCQTAVAHFRKKGMVVTDPEPGDIVFFDWNKDGRYDHVGIFDSFQPSRIMFWTIEGNTSLSNQSNGGQVMRRVRNFKSAPVFVRPKHKA